MFWELECFYFGRFQKVRFLKARRASPWAHTQAAESTPSPSAVVAGLLCDVCRLLSHAAPGMGGGAAPAPEWPVLVGTCAFVRVTPGPVPKGRSCDFLC